MSKARDALRKDRQTILDLFDSRCLVCGAKTDIIHEIIPISHGKNSLKIENRVPLCLVHHDWAHSVGTNNSIPILQQKREEYLVRHNKAI